MIGLHQKSMQCLLAECDSLSPGAFQLKSWPESLRVWREIEYSTVQQAELYIENRFAKIHS